MTEEKIMLPEETVYMVRIHLREKGYAKEIICDSLESYEAAMDKLKAGFGRKVNVELGSAKLQGKSQYTKYMQVRMEEVIAIEAEIVHYPAREGYTLGTAAVAGRPAVGLNETKADPAETVAKREVAAQSQADLDAEVQAKKEAAELGQTYNPKPPGSANVVSGARTTKN